MGIQDLGKYNARMAHARRGRPRVASDELRENQYRDEQGKYVLTGGLKLWHERIVEYLLSHPNAKIVDVAREFDVTPQWIGQLMKTDAFKTYYQEVMGGHLDLVQDMVVHKLHGVAMKALDKMSDKLDEADASFGMARDAATLALKSAGFGATETSIQAGLKDAAGNMMHLTVNKKTVERARQMIHQRAKETSKKLEHDPSNYTHVTSSLEVPDTVEDAVVVSEDKGETS